MSKESQVTGKNSAALFTLKIHRGEDMALRAMNWKQGKPPNDFVGFAIEYRSPREINSLPLKTGWRFPALMVTQSKQTLHEPFADPEISVGKLPTQRRA